ncbi:hypothetical protein L7F22_018755 [Adiantum nelumboides]|nr:hypothetical protein [Adiantum nelumboides]
MATSALCARSPRFREDLCLVHFGSENRFKRRRQKTVTWPIDEKICEVRLFLADDAPSFLGAAVQNSLHCMVAKGLINNGTQHFAKLDVWGAKRVRVEHDNVPPGVGLSSEAGKSWQPNAELDAGMAVTCSWRQPLKFLLDDSWLWARGEDSVEIASQQQRERRFFEAFYPRLVSIPDRPMEPQEPSQEINDTLVAGIPLVPFEDEEMVNENAEQESIDTENGVPNLPLKGIYSTRMTGDEWVCFRPYVGY